MKAKFVEGMTLLDLIISLSITVVMLGIAVPGTSTFITANRIAGQVNDLSSAIALTRSEAIRRNQHVVICKSADGNSCTRSGRWDIGWLVYVDANMNRKWDSKKRVLHVQGKVPDGYTIRYSAFGSRHYVAYRPTGHTRTNGTFYICKPKEMKRSRALILTKSGRVRLSKTRANGEPITC
jgi:type IV fimbrial biogenesis protein FimT